MEHEMNFMDLCAACFRALGRLCVAGWHMLERMIRLTYRYWWIVLTFLALSIAAALYYSRVDNLTFRANAIALLNGPSVQQFEQAYAPLRTGILVPEEAPILPYLAGHTAFAFTTYPVIDCLDDGYADKIDFKHKTSATDTVNVVMQDRLCLQFRIKAANLGVLPAIEQAIVDFLNGNNALQQSYAKYYPNLVEEVAFNHAQAHKLDSLTSCYYFYPASNAQPMAYNGNGVNFYGDRRVRLFLEDIYKQQQHMQQVDYRLQLATAPVVLENHFAVDPKPVNGRYKCLLLFFLIGWIVGCGLAEMIDKRKALIAWLKA